MKNHLRLFGGRAAASAAAAAEAAPATSETAGVPVVDRVGEAFEAARESGIGAALWRVDTIEDLPRLATDTVVLYAAHDRNELERGWALMRRQPTVVMGIGLGAEAGSRALNLGAVGYIHDGLDHDQLSRGFADAIARQRYRSIRATGRLALSA